MARRTIPIDEKIEKAQEDVVRAKERYDNNNLAYTSNYTVLFIFMQQFSNFSLVLTDI